MNTLHSPLIGIGLRHPHYAAVFETRPALDFLEVHAENFFAQGGATLQVLDQAASLYPMSLHGVGLSLGSARGIDDWHLDQLQRLVERVNPMLVSDHACFGYAQSEHTPIHANDLLPIRWTRASLDILCANVSTVQDRLKRRIAVENISAYVQWSQADFSETDFLNALAKRTGCGLLLDLNNIYVNALNAARLNDLQPLQPAQQAAQALASCQSWIESIKPAAVMEYHLAGYTPSDTLVIDDHASAVHEPVWQLYRHALATLGHAPTLIEWDLELPTLDVLLAEASTAKRIALKSVPSSTPTSFAK